MTIRLSIAITTLATASLAVAALKMEPNDHDFNASLLNPPTSINPVDPIPDLETGPPPSLDTWRRQLLDYLPIQFLHRDRQREVRRHPSIQSAIRQPDPWTAVTAALLNVSTSPAAANTISLNSREIVEDASPPLTNSEAYDFRMQLHEDLTSLLSPLETLLTQAFPQPQQRFSLRLRLLKHGWVLAELWEARTPARELTREMFLEDSGREIPNYVWREVLTRQEARQMTTQNMILGAERRGQTRLLWVCILLLLLMFHGGLAIRLFLNRDPPYVHSP